jgi:hypothetical protein
MTVLKKLYPTFCVGMGLYGSYRGYKSKPQGEYHLLTIDKFSRGFINGIMYAAPVANIWPTVKLLNRVEIEYKQLDKSLYKSNYEEIVGVCEDTF